MHKTRHGGPPRLAARRDETQQEHGGRAMGRNGTQSWRRADPCSGGRAPGMNSNTLVLEPTGTRIAQRIPDASNRSLRQAQA